MTVSLALIESAVSGIVNNGSFAADAIVEALITEQPAKLLGTDPKKLTIRVSWMGTPYTYTAPPDVFAKFKRMMGYGAGTRAVNWLKKQAGVSFKREAALHGLQGVG